MSSRSQSAADGSVSVVIAAYNAGGTIARTLRSVYAQRFPHIREVIVVDDGSRDNTAQVIGEQFPEVVLLQQENSGPGIARNAGVAAARGEYVAFLDADDQWLADKISLQIQYMQEDPELALSGTFVLDFMKDAEIEQINARTLQTPPVRRPASYLSLVDVLEKLGGIRLSTWLIRREVFLRHGGFTYPVFPVEDLEFLLRLASLGEKIGVVPIALCVLDLCDSGHQSARRESKLRSIRHVPLILAKFAPTSIPEGEPCGIDRRGYDSIVSRHLITLGVWALSLGEWDQGCELLRQAVRLDPEASGSLPLRAMRCTIRLLPRLLGGRAAAGLLQSLLRVLGWLHARTIRRADLRQHRLNLSLLLQAGSLGDL